MNNPTSDIKVWEYIGLIAAIVIVVSLPVYYITAEKNRELPLPGQNEEVATFVGSEKCRDCHKAEYDKWQGSHHDHAMEVASEESVLGDFNDAEYTIHGITTRFYRKAGGFFVYTHGPGGEMGEFEISHTFGWYPLQQYLVPFPAAGSSASLMPGISKKRNGTGCRRWRTFRRMTGSTGPTAVRTGTVCVPNATPPT